ncbi:response regulator [Catalinimonas niigatensis]|uniref:response regulator n=1 Tax=Catalinimonas niigatensis TaxID=1397264 RepID=UPI00266682B1|nr:response regulator [Catalinimonas niigatensis]WPP51492.1 response regulator [Catalinimonas niigatensis]
MKGKRILILDDEKEICFLLSALLKQMGYIPDQAFTIEEALSKFERNAYDLIFLDLNLPDGLGYHLVPVIKKYNQNSKIIMISAHDGMLKQIQSEIKGIDYFIDKPFNREKISEALTKIDMLKYSTN